MEEDILKDLAEIDLEKEPPKKFSKAIFFILSVVAIVLITSYVFVTFPIADIIKGKAESTLLEGNRLDVQDLSIIFEEGTAEQLESLYFEEQKHEFSVCLSGSKDENEYYIDSLYQPKQRRSFNQVTFEPCSLETLIILHTHPYKRCVASSTDLQMLSRTKRGNADALMVVMCEPRRFSVYG